jgi:hypothetical protein
MANPLQNRGLGKKECCQLLTVRLQTKECIMTRPFLSLLIAGLALAQAMGAETTPPPATQPAAAPDLSKPADHKPPRSWDEGEGLTSTSPALCVPKGSKNVRWVAEAPNWCYGLPVEVDERVFFMCEPGAEGMRWPTPACLDPKAGKEQWRTEIKHFDCAHSPRNDAILKMWRAQAEGRRDTPPGRLLFANFPYGSLSAPAAEPQATVVRGQARFRWRSPKARNRATSILPAPRRGRQAR